MHLDAITRAFAKSMVPLLSAAITQVDGWSVNILDSISRHVPSVKTLTLIGMFDRIDLSVCGLVFDKIPGLMELIITSIFRTQ